MYSLEGVTVYLDGTVCSGGEAEGDTITNIEQIYGSAYDDNLFGDEFNNSFFGMLGADYINGGDGIDRVFYNDSTVGVTVYLDGTVGSNGSAQGDTLFNIENLQGSYHNDILNGDENNNTIYGSNGDDIINSGAGDDIIYGGNGADTIDGGDGDADWIYYNDSSVGVTVSLLDGTGFGGTAEGDTITNVENIYGSGHDDILIGNDNDNTFIGNTGADNIDGRLGNDTISYDKMYGGFIVYLDGRVCGGHAQSLGDVLTNVENIIGGYHSDELYGNDESNIIEGSNGNDIIEGGAGADTLDGGSGGDTLIYSNSDAAVAVSLLDNTASGGHAEGDIISDFENITGSNYDDTLIGNDGGNRIEGGEGADYLDGGAGYDYLIYTNSSAGVNVNLETGVVSGGEAEGDTIFNFEGIYGSAYDDVLIGNGTYNYFWGGEGADYIDGGNGNTDNIYYQNSSAGVTVYLDGTVCSGGEAEGDVIINVEGITGSSYNDVIYGNDSNNTITLGEGDDIAYGGAGDDTIYSGLGANTIDGGDGNDWIQYYSAQGAVTISLIDGTTSIGGVVVDTITNIENIAASYRDDIIIGDENDNIITDHNGADYVDGGDGIDTFRLYVHDEAIVYLDGTVCSGNQIDGGILINIENVVGSYNNDTIYGNEFDNVIDGNRGNNTIIGRGGADTLRGGGNLNTFVYELATDSSLTSFDTITDFTQGNDSLQFVSSEFGTDWTAFSVDTSSGTETVITHSTLTDFELHLTGTYILTESDFDFV